MIEREGVSGRTRTSVPRLRFFDVYLSRHLMESEAPPRDYRDGIPLVVHVCHASSQQPIDEIGKVLVPDSMHPVTHHAHSYIRTELQLKEDTVEEGECCAERVADGYDGRYVLGPESSVDDREDGDSRTACAILSARCGGPQTEQTTKDILLLAASLTYISCMYLGKTVMDLHRRWDSGKEGWVGSLEEEISIGHEGEAGVRSLRSAALMKEDRMETYILLGTVP